MRRLYLFLLLILIEVSCAARPPPSKCGKTKPHCRKLAGVCKLEGTCDGTAVPGKKYCQKWWKCDCCPDCEKGTLPSCLALNGTCVDTDKECPDRSDRVVRGKTFCKSAETCKCCFPGCTCEPPVCKTSNGVAGTCSLVPIEDYQYAGQLQCEDPCGCWIPDPTTSAAPSTEVPTTTVTTTTVPTTTVPTTTMPTGECDNNRPCKRPGAEGYDPNGTCRKKCLDDEDPYGLCDIPNQECDCCLRKKGCEPSVCKTNNGVVGTCSLVPIKDYKYAGQLQCEDPCGCWIPECRSIGDRCLGDGAFCIEPQEKCPDGFKESSDCFKHIINENGVSQSKICKCCKPLYVDNDCERKYDCGDELDYCVDKYPVIQLSDCPAEGYAILYNACLKKTTPFPVPCDCCKSLKCRPIKDRCTGKGEFCIDPETTKSCPVGYSGSDDCYKPVIQNGQIVASKKCICCKPIDCGPVCNFPNLQTCQCMIPGVACPGGLCYYDAGDICPPDSCICCEEAPHTRCLSIKDECTGPQDYCVDKSPAKCPIGWLKVEDTCYMNISVLGILCDCCKSKGCIPTGDQCSGPGDFCTDKASCPPSYTEFPGCHKVSEDGKWIPCTCCKPKFIDATTSEAPSTEVPTTTTPAEDCENNRKCDRPDAEGYYPTGHCRKTCHDDEEPYDKCHILSHADDPCLCCLRKKDNWPPVCGGEGCEQGYSYYPPEGQSCPTGSVEINCLTFAIGEICCEGEVVISPCSGHCTTNGQKGSCYSGKYCPLKENPRLMAQIPPVTTPISEGPPPQCAPGCICCPIIQELPVELQIKRN